jgi:large subunit ribosomal protein L29
MKTSELRAMDDTRLQQLVNERYQELFNLRFQQSVGRLTATGRPRVVRREIAQIKTVLREGELVL